MQADLFANKLQKTPKEDIFDDKIDFLVTLQVKTTTKASKT